MRSLTKRSILIWMSIVLLIASTSFSAAADTMRAAKLTDFKGAVEIFKAGGEKGFNAFKGMGLAEGDRVVTGGNSWALLQIDDDKEVEVGKNTSMTISELRGSLEEGDDQTSLGLQAGKIFTKIKKKLNVRSKYEVKTPTTVMGVRGTQFFVALEGTDTYIAVLEGQLYAIAIDTEADGITGEELEALLNANEQLTIGEVLDYDSGLTVQPVDLNDLDIMVLESIQRNPEGIDPEILQQLDEVIEQKKQEQEENNNNGINNQQQNIIFDSGNNDDDDYGYEPPAQSVPSIVITDINNITMAAGEEREIPLSVTPAGASVSVISSPTGVALVERDGNYLYIEAIGVGTATITVSASANGYTSAERQFTVTVTQPSVLIADFDDIEMEVDDDRAIQVSTTPAAVSVSVMSSDTDVVEILEMYELEGVKYFDIEAVGIGTATITVSASADGYISAEKQFTVSVTIAAPDIKKQLSTGYHASKIESGESITFEFTESLNEYSIKLIESRIKNNIVWGYMGGLEFNWYYDNTVLEVSNNNIDGMDYYFKTDIVVPLEGLSENSANRKIMDIGPRGTLLPPIMDEEYIYGFVIGFDQPLHPSTTAISEADDLFSSISVSDGLYGFGLSWLLDDPEYPDYPAVALIEFPDDFPPVEHNGEPDFEIGIGYYSNMVIDVCGNWIDGGDEEIWLYTFVNESEPLEITAMPKVIRVGSNPLEFWLELDSEGDEAFNVFDYAEIRFGGALYGLTREYAFSEGAALIGCDGSSLITEGTGTIEIIGGLESGRRIIVNVKVVGEDESIPPYLEYITIYNNLIGQDEVIVNSGDIYGNTYDYPVKVRIYDSPEGGNLLGEEDIGEGPACFTFDDGFDRTLSAIYVTAQEVYLDETGYPIENGEGFIRLNESERVEVQIPVPILNRGYYDEDELGNPEYELGYDYYAFGYYDYGRIRFIMTQNQKQAIEEATGKTVDKVIAYIAGIDQIFNELPAYDEVNGVVIEIGDDGTEVEELELGWYGYAIAVYDENHEVIAYYVSDDDYYSWLRVEAY